MTHGRRERQLPCRERRLQRHTKDQSISRSATSAQPPRASREDEEEEKNTHTHSPTSQDHRAEPENGEKCREKRYRSTAQNPAMDWHRKEKKANDRYLTTVVCVCV